MTEPQPSYALSLSKMIQVYGPSICRRTKTNVIAIRRKEKKRPIKKGKFPDYFSIKPLNRKKRSEDLKKKKKKKIRNH